MQAGSSTCASPRFAIECVQQASKNNHNCTFSPSRLQIIGGSFISTGQLASKYARYQFRPHFFQHASFRVVQSTVDLSLYDMERYGVQNPVEPFFETSCMDCAPPYVGDRPCCSKANRSRCAGGRFSYCVVAFSR